MGTGTDRRRGRALLRVSLLGWSGGAGLVEEGPHSVAIAVNVGETFIQGERTACYAEHHPGVGVQDPCELAAVVDGDFDAP